MNSPEFQPSKRHKSSLSAPERSVSSRSTISRVSRYPEAAQRLHREVHAPVRPQKFGSFTALSQFRASTSTATSFGGEEYSGSKMGSILSKKYDRLKRSALDSLRFFKANQTLELVDDGTQEEVSMSKDSSVESIEVGDGLKGADKVATNLQESVVSELSNGHVARMDKADELDPMSLDRDDGDLKVLSKNAYKKLLEDVHRREPKLEGLEFEIKFVQEKWSSLQLQRPPKKVEEIPSELFVPLTDEEEAEVKKALSGNRRKVLVSHDNSSIVITGEVLQCLRPKAWLNDEVINLYLELLKERERREPKKFLKCHFFNTFFYKKVLVSLSSVFSPTRSGIL